MYNMYTPSINEARGPRSPISTNADAPMVTATPSCVPMGYATCMTSVAKAATPWMPHFEEAISARLLGGHALATIATGVTMPGACAPCTTSVRMRACRWMTHHGIGRFARITDANGLRAARAYAGFTLTAKLRDWTWMHRFICQSGARSKGAIASITLTTCARSIMTGIAGAHHWLRPCALHVEGMRSELSRHMTTDISTSSCEKAVGSGGVKETGNCTTTTSWSSTLAARCLIMRESTIGMASVTTTALRTWSSGPKIIRTALAWPTRSRGLLNSLRDMAIPLVERATPCKAVGYGH